MFASNALWHTVSMDTSAAIGVFDSGVGGVSVLKALVAELPRERFIYLGDSANAPYGEKSADEIFELTRACVETLLDKGAKAIVLACNTATSAAAKRLRSTYSDLPIIGIEPALKPAVEACPGASVLVMATPATLALDKFHDLARTLDEKAEIIPAPCPGLAARIEQGDLDSPDVEELVRELVGGYAGEADAVVLGCTHYPFVARQIRSVLGPVPLFDGGVGTAHQLARVLKGKGLLSEAVHGGVEFLSTKEGPDEPALFKHLFEREL